MYYDEEEIRRKAERVQQLIDKAINSNNLEATIRYLDEALDLAEADGVNSVASMIWGMKGCVFMDAGSPSLAIRCLKNGLMADPSNEKNYEILGKLYIEIDEPEMGMRYIDQGRRLSYRRF